MSRRSRHLGAEGLSLRTGSRPFFSSETYKPKNTSSFMK